MSDNLNIPNILNLSPPVSFARAKEHQKFVFFGSALRAQTPHSRNSNTHLQSRSQRLCSYDGKVRGTFVGGARASRKWTDACSFARAKEIVNFNYSNCSSRSGKWVKISTFKIHFSFINQKLIQSVQLGTCSGLPSICLHISPDNYT